MARSYRTPGTKPQPTHLKLIKGTPSRLLNHAEPKPPPILVTPTAPAHLNAHAKVEWARVVEIMVRLGILTEIDRGILAAYCQAYGRWVDAEEELTKHAEGKPFKGLMITTKSGNVINHPLLGIANKAMADMARYATDLGMSPSARSRLQTNEQEDALDPAAKYFR